MGHELFVVLGVQLELVVQRQDDPETVFVCGVPLGCVHQELVVLEQQLGGTHVDAAIHVDHCQVEAWDAVLFVTVATIEVVGSPVHTLGLGQLVKLVKRWLLVAVVGRDVSAVRNHHLGQVGFLQGFPTQELDPIGKSLLDDDVVLVAIGSCQCHQLVLVAGPSLVEGQVFCQVGLRYVLPYGCDVLG